MVPKSKYVKAVTAATATDVVVTSASTNSTVMSIIVANTHATIDAEVLLTITNDSDVVQSTILPETIIVGKDNYFYEVHFNLPAEYKVKITSNVTHVDITSSWTEFASA